MSTDDKTLGEIADIIALSNDKLREFVLAFVDGRIFTDKHVHNPKRDLGMVFMPIALGAFSGWTEDQLNNVGCIYEYIDQAGPRSINGMPVFFSFRILSAEQWDQAREAIVKEQARRKKIEI